MSGVPTSFADLLQTTHLSPVVMEYEDMSMVIWHITMSLDGFIAGPEDSMDWAVREWSDEGANTRDIEVERSTMADDVLRSAGAILGGRRWYDAAQRLFDGVDGIYGGEWHGPVFVLTHRDPDEAPDASVTFLSTPLADAVATTQEAAKGSNVVIFGASIARQCLQQGLLDEIVIHLAPVLLGDGVRLYESIGTDPVVLTRTDVATTGQLMDLRFRV
jgi:dihydrofolate reductase